MLHEAAKHNRKAVFSLLLENGGSGINDQDKSGNTALHIAIKGNKKDLVRALSTSGANTNHVSINGDTALHLATRGNEKINHCAWNPPSGAWCDSYPMPLQQIGLSVNKLVVVSFSPLAQNSKLKT